MKASANMWFWSLRDFAILVMAALLSVLFAALTKIVLPLALVLCFGVLTIRADDTTILDYIKYAVLHVKNYNKLDGKYRYSDDYLFTWSDEAGTFVFKDVDDLTPEERAGYPLP